MFWWGIAIGFVVGANFGITVLALLKMNKS